jgi:cysteine desulfurase
MKHYLDYNATAPIRPEVLAVMQSLLALPLNSSSVHASGRRAKAVIEDARRSIAEHISAFANELVFTGSGTEANNWVLRAFSHLPLFVSAIEHSSIYKAAKVIGKTAIIPVDANGVVDVATLEAQLAGQNNFLVSVMLANNETGVIQPIRAIAEIVHAKSGLLHCDAIQALGKIEVNFSDLGCDLMTLSAHKMGGPVGAAALVIRDKLTVPAMLIGGGQELNRRAGTENIAAIGGFAKATELADLDHMKKLRGWLDQMETELPRELVIGASVPRLPNTSCIIMPNVLAETQLISFDLEGIAVSAGSACSSGRIEPSHVLKAMGIEDKMAAGTIRVSGGWGTTDKDIDITGRVWKKLFHSKNIAMQ